MGLITGNRSLQGSPMAPYPQVQTLDSQDVFIDLVFVDHTNTPVIPTSIKVELDDITNSQAMDNGPITLNAAGSTSGSYIYPAFASGAPTPWTLQISGTIMKMTFPYEGSQVCTFKMVFTAVDTVTGQPFTSPTNQIVIELFAVPTVSGAL